MWSWCSRATRQLWEKNPAGDVPSKEGAAKILPPPLGVVRIVRNVDIASKDSGFVESTGIHNDICFVVACASEQIFSFLTHVVSKSEVGIAVAGINLQAAKPMDQENVDYTCNGIGAVHGRSAVFQNVDVIDQSEGELVEVYLETVETVICEATPIL